MRHLEALIDGQDFDPATGIPHGAFVMATVAVYMDAWVNNKLIDNRPIPGKTGDMIEALNRLPGQAKMSPKAVQVILESIINNKQVGDDNGE
jgi:hypothetical protein